MKLIVGAIAILLLVPQASAELTHAPERRTTYLWNTLNALRAAPDQSVADIYRYLYMVHRNQCKAPLQSLQVGCLMEAARESCSQRGSEMQRCNLVSDVIAANLLSENQFVSLSERLAIMQDKSNADTKTSYQQALSRQLRRRYAALVTEMAMTTGRADSNLARAIDGYCRDVAGERDLSWHHCTAAIVWFIGTSGRDL